MMPDNLDHPALFADSSHLLSALHMLIPRGSLYPGQLLFVQDRGWAIDANVLGSPANLTKLASQHGWKVEFPKNLVGRWVVTPSALAGQWAYCDPLQAVEWAGHTAALPPESSSWAWLDPSIPHMQFLLGAKDDAKAQRILDHLSAFLAQGIRAVPILLESAGGATCPFRHFWNVFLERPNPFLFDSADCVWWGPIGYGQVQLFLEYPWSLAVPNDLLHRMPWAPGTGIVLLSKGSPAVIELRLAPDGDIFTDYLGVVELTKGAAQVCLPLVASQQRPEASFEVDIRLGGPDPRVAARRRIEELRREIAAKQLLLEHMLACGGQEEQSDVVADPLFVYAQTAAERGRTPLEIQRLLLECADQPEELGAIYYAFLPGDSLPKGLFIEGSCLHVVTAATALGLGSSFAAGARLLDFAPQTLNSWSLTLDQDWADYRLRLFTPATDHVWLYPNLRPSSFTAERLASAIHPKAGAKHQDWLYLLLPGLAGQLHFLVLPTNAFKPLSVAFQWILDIDIGMSMPNVSKVLQGRTLSAVCEAVDANLTSVVEKEATVRMDAATSRLKNEVKVLQARLDDRIARIEKALAASNQLDQKVREVTDAIQQAATFRLDAATDRLKKEVAILEGRLNDRAVRVQGVALASNELDQRVKEIHQSLNDVLKISSDLTSTLQSMEDNFHASDNQLESFRKLIERHSKLQQRIRHQITAIRAMRRRCKQSST